MNKSIFVLSVLVLMAAAVSSAEVSNVVGGTVVQNIDRTFTFVPDPEFVGIASFDYTITDGNGATDSATVRINVLETNEPPVAEDDAALTDQKTPVNITHAYLLLNDSDPDGDPLQMVSESRLFGCNSGVLWVSDAERGLTLENRSFHGFRRMNHTGVTRVRTVEDPVHSGMYANEVTIDTTSGVSAVRHIVTEIGGSDPLPDTAYYSAWYRFPEMAAITGYWGVMDWPTRTIKADGTEGATTAYSVVVQTESPGVLRFALNDQINDAGGWADEGIVGQSGSFQAGAWVHLECLYGWHVEKMGEITCWVDGTPAWSLQAVQTEKVFATPAIRSWNVRSYADQGAIDPPVATIHWDDAVISTKQIGPECFIN